MSTFAPLLQSVVSRVRPPLLVVLGGGRTVLELLVPLRESLVGQRVVCWQMDHFQADRLREELAAAEIPAEVVTTPDLWDLPAEFRTAIYPAPERGERELKIDVIEQVFHVLQPRGTLLTLSPHTSDIFFPKLLKKVFGRTGSHAAETGTAFVNQREGDRPRRRHELVVHARFAPEQEALKFVTRPGVFSYGEFDEGARALAETLDLMPHYRVLDLGCGYGSVGVWAGKLLNEKGRVTLVDSNARAVALAAHNAAANGVTNAEALAVADPTTLPAGTFDLVLANPPYYGSGSIAKRFIDAAFRCLKPLGRLAVVTRQPNEIAPLLADVFGEAMTWERRGYAVFEAERPDREKPRPKFVKE